MGFFYKIEVEHDFLKGLSSRVFLKFARPRPNFMKILNPYDFAVATSYAKLAMTERLNYNIFDFKQF